MRLNWLEEQFKGKVICRDYDLGPIEGRGWKLRETTREDASDTVRDAIDRAMRLYYEEKEN